MVAEKLCVGETSVFRPILTAGRADLPQPVLSRAEQIVILDCTLLSVMGQLFYSSGDRRPG